MYKTDIQRLKVQSLILEKLIDESDDRINQAQDSIDMLEDERDMYIDDLITVRGSLTPYLTEAERIASIC